MSDALGRALEDVNSRPGPLEGFIDANPPGPKPEELTVREAADELRNRRGPSREVDVVRALDSEGEPIDDPKAVYKGDERDLRKVAADMSAQREQKAKFLASLQPETETEQPQEQQDHQQQEQEAQPEQQQPAEPTEQEQQRAQQYEAEIARARTAVAQLEQATSEAGQFAFAAFQADFPDITTPAAVEMLRVQNPARYAQFQTRMDALMNVAGRVHQLQTLRTQDQQQRQQQQEKSWQKYIAGENEKFVKTHPELQTAESQIKLRNMAQSFLAEHGITVDEFRNAIASSPMAQSAAGQAIILNAIRYHESQKQVQKLVAKPLPPAQKPGVARGHMSANSEAIQRLERLPSLTTKQAAQLMQMRRVARNGR